ncbi:MAG: hypothetical protein H0X38_10830 [Planctomycetes bacterium]|nr:hypothetical protein [Planctomycetota bacterium]
MHPAPIPLNAIYSETKEMVLHRMRYLRTLQQPARVKELLVEIIATIGVLEAEKRHTAHGRWAARLAAAAGEPLNFFILSAVVKDVTEEMEEENYIVLA